MTALQDDELDPVPIGRWVLPADVPGFLAWLREAIPRGTDRERIETFLTYPAAELLPDRLREELLLLR